MAENKIIGYKRVFGFVVPDWVSERLIRNIVASMLSVVVMLFVLILVIWPKFATVRIKDAELKASKQDLEVLRSSGQGLDKLKTDLPESDQQKILAAMPTIYSPDGAIFLIRKISADTGVSIVSYSLPAGELVTSTQTKGVDTSGEMVSFIAYPIRITVEAPVDSLLRFISEVESSLPFGVVSDLNLQEVVRLSRSVSDKTVQLAMEIKFFQANLKNVNINKLKPLTAENMSLAKELLRYNYLVVPESTGDLSDGVSSGSGSIFGF